MMIRLPRKWQRVCVCTMCAAVCVCILFTIQKAVVLHTALGRASVTHPKHKEPLVLNNIQYKGDTYSLHTVTLLGEDVGLVDHVTGLGRMIDWHDYQFMNNESQRHGPGEHGVAVGKTEADFPDGQQLYKKHGINIALSNIISLDRSIKDLRDPYCGVRVYYENLPNTSVIIPFHNEGLSVLLRTVHSVVNRTPAKLLAEIILVDDASTVADLGSVLDVHVERYGSKVKVLRSSERLGLVGARLLGASDARGEVLLFLDSHCEAGVNWLPPLLERIARHKRRVVMPMIDVIDQTNLQLSVQPGGVLRGAFSWDFLYKRIPITKEEKTRRAHHTDAFRSPVMAGGLFAIDKSWFYELGGYDPELGGWGGENFELSFKIWMCGGELEEVPCSRVGHVYRKFMPYTLPGGHMSVLRNYARVAEVWLDEYKQYFYARKRVSHLDIGDLSAQHKLRDTLHCHSFKWFMDNVAYDIPRYYPPVEPKPYIYSWLHNPHTNLCLTVSEGQLIGSTCYYDLDHDKGSVNRHQTFSFTWHKDVSQGTQCWDYANTHIKMFVCHKSQGNQWFDYNHISKHVYHVPSGRCVGIQESVYMSDCVEGDISQIWEVSHYNDTLHSQIVNI